MDLSTLRFAIEDGIATMTFARPEKRNALDLTMRREIARVVERVDHDPEIRALVLMSSGGSFCAGGDIAGQLTREPGTDAARRRMRDNWDWVQALVSLDRPVIAAVDGPAAGAGFNIALAADFVLATPRASFCQSFAKIGLVPDLGGLHLLPRIVGLQRAKEIVFSARTIGAQEALELGIAYRIVPVDALEREARALARRFVDASPAALGLAKGILNGSFSTDLHTSLELEAAAQGICFETPYHRDAIERFLSKTPLRFPGFDREA